MDECLARAAPASAGHESMKRQYVLGYDPGGADANGIAIAVLSPDGVVARPTLTTRTVSTVRETIEWIERETGDGSIKAFGIDTLTCWSLSRSGDRPADIFLRAACKAMAQSIISPNSLRGAMATGGAALLVHMKDRWARDSTNITETHPKVLYPVISEHVYNWKEGREAMVDWIAGYFDMEAIPANDHEFDAALSAFAALQGYLGTWTLDLHRSGDGDRRDIVEYVGPTHFWWPEVRPLKGRS